MSRKLTVDVEVIDPRNVDNFGFKVANDGQFLLFTQSGQPDSNGWNKVYVSGSSSIVLVNRIVKLDSNLGATSSFIGSIPNGDVLDMTYNSFGNGVVAVGSFNQWASNSSSVVTANRLISLSDNTTSYNAYGSGVSGTTYRVVMNTSTNETYIGGLFTVVNGNVINRICKFTGGGSVDITFRNNIMSAATNKGFNNTVRAIAVDSSGRIVVGGDFTNFNNTVANRLIRLNSNGTIDTSFDTYTGVNGSIEDIKIQSDGKIICVGNFTRYRGVVCNKIMRLLSNGNIDYSFNVLGDGNGFNQTGETALCIKIGSTGDVYVGGNFSKFNGNTRNRIVKLNSTGIDLNTFGTAFNDISFAKVNAIELQDDNKILVGGSFTKYQGATCSCFVKLNTDGSLNSKLDFNGAITSIKNGALGSFYLGGGFTQYQRNSTPISNLYNIPLGVGQSVNYGSGFNLPGGSPIVTKIGLDVDYLGDIIAFGNFTTYNGLSSPRLIKIKEIGTPGTLAVPGVVNPYTEKIVVKSNGYMVAFCDSYQGTPAVGKMIGIKQDMTVDTSFVSQGFNYTPIIKDVQLLNDGSFLVVGKDLAYGSATFSDINGVKISATGSLLNSYRFASGSFGSPSIEQGTINSVSLCPLTGRVAFGGSFFIGTFGNTISESGLTGNFPVNTDLFKSFLVTDGDAINIINNYNFPNAFNTANLDEKLISVNWTIDGRIILTGEIEGIFYYQSNPFVAIGLGVNIIRLNGDGSFDASFVNNIPITYNNSIDNIPITYNNSIDDVKFINNYNALDGTYTIKTLIHGSFSNYNGMSVNYLAKLNEDGTLDTTFNTGGSGFNTKIDDLVIINNNIICVGSMTSYNGVGLISNRIIMLDINGNVTTTTSGLYESVQNTYDNMVEFNSGYGVTYSIIDTTVRMEYEFDDDEIVVSDLFDVPDHVELSFTNESININEKIQEIVTKSDHKIQTHETDPFDLTNFKIKIYDGSLLIGVTASPVKFNIPKPKIVSNQTNIYIDISNLIREDFEWNVGYFYGQDLTSAAQLPDNICKWVYIEETNYLRPATASVSIEKHYIFAIDGLLYDNEIQHVPNLLVNGVKRYVHREQQQRIFFQSNFLVGIQVVDELGNSYNPTYDANIELDNKKYVQSLMIDTSSPSRYVDYIFTYASNSGDTTNGRSYYQSIRYYFYDSCGNDYLELVFKNKWGVLESLAVAKKHKVNLTTIGEEYTRSIVDYNGNYDITRHTTKKFDVDMEQSFTLNTDVLPEYMNDAIVDLYLSEEVWLKSDSNYIPVLVDGSVGDLKQRIDAPIAYTIKVKASHNKIKNIL